MRTTLEPLICPCCQRCGICDVIEPKVIEFSPLLKCRGCGHKWKDESVELSPPEPEARHEASREPHGHGLPLRHGPA